MHLIWSPVLCSSVIMIQHHFQREEEVYGLNHPEKKLQRQKDFMVEKKRLRKFWPDSRLEDHFKSLDKSRKWE